MKSIPLSLLLGLAAACSSDVDLQLDVEGPPVGPAPNHLDHLDWATLDRGPLYVHDVEFFDIEWAPDGSLVALFEERSALEGHRTGVRRFSSDGQLLWQVTFQNDMNGPNGVDFGPLEATSDGPLVAGRLYGTIDLGNGPIEGADDDNSFLAAYDPSGTLLSVRVFPGVRIFGMRALPDGEALIMTYERRGETWRAFLERVDAAGTSVWRVEIPFGVGTGGLLVHDGKAFFSEWFLGTPLIPGAPTRSVSAVSLADGQLEWTTTFECVDAGSDFGQGPMIISEEGALLVAAEMSGVVKAGSFELAAASDQIELAVVEMDLDGNVVGARHVVRPPELYYAGMTSIGDHLALVGETDRGYDVDLGNGQRVNGGFAAIVDPAGRFVASRSIGLAADPEIVNQTGDVDLGPDDRLAISGRFTGVADLGEGPVDTGVDPPKLGTAGYIAVYGPERPSVD
jgi:hypothetical protein